MHPLAVHAELVLVGALVQVYDGDEVFGRGAHPQLLPVVEGAYKYKEALAITGYLQTFLH